MLQVLGMLLMYLTGRKVHRKLLCLTDLIVHMLLVSVCQSGCKECTFR